MDTIYYVCAVVGGTLIICQFLLGLLGLGHHDASGGDGGLHDVGGHDVAGHDGGGGHDTAQETHEGASTWFLSMLTFRTVVAGLAFFGLAGLAATSEGLPPAPAFGIALGAGLAALLVVGWMMRTLGKLNVDGTARIERAVGTTGTVYLSIPGGKGGVGKVHISLQNRTLECKAVTSREDLPTGAKIVVVGVVAKDTVEVSPVTSVERTSYV